eukprot:scaffold327_cov166-Isochrysis_galbana.AAC.1
MWGQLGPTIQLILPHKRGLTDIYPFLTNDAPGGFTRLTATVHTRIDRIYGPTENTSWRWIAAAAEPTIFTGKAASDHLPMVGSSA